MTDAGQRFAPSEAPSTSDVGNPRETIVDITFLTGTNATFLAELYNRYLKNPAAVDPSWTKFFSELGDDPAGLMQELTGAAWSPSEAAIIGVADPDAAPAKKDGKGAKGAAPAVDQKAVLK